MVKYVLHVGSTVKVGENYHKVAVGLEDDVDGALADAEDDEMMDHFDELESVLQVVLGEKLSNLIEYGEEVAAKGARRKGRRR